ncbi:MAG: DUF4931 domain-containing protein [Patescibacteria group bacterium]
MASENKTNQSSELRQDIVSGEWVTIATARAKRPHDFLLQKRQQFDESQECPFEHLLPNNLLTLNKKEEGEWWVQVVKNKYPAFAEGICKVIYPEGPYIKMDGAGSHEVVITRDHARSFGSFTAEESTLLIQAYVSRMKELSLGECVDYISVFHNHGPESGATVAHPHSQIISLPVVPPDIERSVRGSYEYFDKNKRCVHCDIIYFESKQKSRIVYENKHCIVFCPFASKTAFEMRVFPKEHSPEFHSMDLELVAATGDAIQKSLAKLGKGLQDPAYNFFVHTAPIIEYADHSHYHWHIEILPKTAIWAGFEIGTGIEISTIAPEAAAEFLKEQ